MNAFEIIEMKQSTTLYLFSLREEIDLDPVYQRMGDVWSKSKRQVLVDTLINGFDVPKIYFHEYSRPKRTANGRMVRFAVVDGKQRLQSIFEFMNNELPLASDITYMPDPEKKIGDMTYEELGKKYPRIKLTFDALSLPVFAIRTEDQDIIEEMFSRLNEASPLNAAEKRNAYGGPMPQLIRKLVKHEFFVDRLPIAANRYRHHDAVTKLLYLSYRNRVVDTKKVSLDRFVESFIGKPKADVASLERSTVRVLNRLCSTFTSKDDLLKSAGMLPVHFMLAKYLQDGKYEPIERSDVAKFDALRDSNHIQAETDESGDQTDLELLEFDRLIQTPNDAYSIRYKCEVFAKRVLKGNIRKAVLDRIASDNGE